MSVLLTLTAFNVNVFLKVHFFRVPPKISLPSLVALLSLNVHFIALAPETLGLSAYLNPYINIESERLAIIPTDSKEEILTYEFKGKLNEKEFLIYVNAITGLEEKVLIIKQTENGTLTM